ncbi:hypothetical protein N0V88_002503 [Collariella sp. IMI 366227]|nr:hypothetical protein N0V88_002503 [Collariella sp. IMI 366227]
MASSRSPSPALALRESTPPVTRPVTNNPFAALSDSDSEADDAILRPRGKIAARMQVRGSERSESESEQEDDANSTRSDPPTRNHTNAASQDDDDEDEDDVSTPQEAPASPGLFVSPSKPQSSNSDDDDVPDVADLTKNSRFQALVAQKRAERRAREAEETRKKAERRKAAGYGSDDGIVADDDDEDVGDITDDEGGRKLTQEVARTRAPRKASKKAMEEMNRETQRLTRSLQLAHEAKVRKKINKASLFERFNFKPAGSEEKTTKELPAQSSSRAPSPVSVQQSDAEMKDAETPPSSPPQAGKEETIEMTAALAPVVLDEDEEDFPTLEEIIVDDAAEESETEEAEEKVDEDEDEDLPLPSLKQTRRRPRKHVTILSDDEDDAQGSLRQVALGPPPRVPSIPTSVLRSATKTFIPGLPVAGPAGLGLTQIFAGTMDDDSQMGTAPVSPTQPRPTFDAAAFPDSNFSQTAGQEAVEDLILDSQPHRETQAETQGVQLRFSQSQFHGFDTFLQETQNPTQMSELLEPTQDSGFRNFTPLRKRFVEAPASTADTIPVGQSQAEAEEVNDSPLVRRTGKLRRKADVVPGSPTRRARADDDGDAVMEDLEADEFGFGTVNNNAFAAMKEAALKEKKRKEAFDKKKSKAREMIEEQAEESEDEYAGLGGADGEDSEDDDESVKEMIDDETKENAEDGRKLAAFYADRERASDEKQVEKLFHDITTGMLRRKRGGNWDDLSDSDDGGEARRRMKRRQFAKMQRALFTDERVSKVAENPRNQAFLRTIEDHGSDDDMDFIFAPPPPVPGVDSQESQAPSAGKATIIPNSQPQAAITTNPRRTKREGKKPANLGEIRESLSNLLDEASFGSSLIPATDPTLSSDEEQEEEPNPSSSNKENRPRHPRRTLAKPSSIVDRIAVKRQASSTLSFASDKLAFSTTTTTSTSTNNNNNNNNSTFKVPALLRRATTNSLLSTSSSTSSSSTATPTGVTTNSGSGKRGDEAGGVKIKKNAGRSLA